MMTRRLLLTTACCAGVVLGGAQAIAQQAAAGLIQPKGGWAVTRIDQSGAQGGAYCTLARQFSNNVIFSIGRNKAEEYSLAIDFQDAKLDPDKAYDVTMKAGNQTRQVQMHPVSARAMVIRLGWDDSFFAAMEKAQSFSIALDKDSYAFALPEYAKGKMDLMQCMQTLKDDAQSGGTDILNAEAGAGAAGFSATRTAAADKIPPTSSAAPDTSAAPDMTKRPEATRITQLETPAVARRASEDKASYVAPVRSADVQSLEAENERLREQLNEQRRSYEARLAENSNQGNRVAELEEKLRLAELRGGAAPVSAAPAVPIPAPIVKEVVKEVEVVKPDPAQAQQIAALQAQVVSLKKQLAAAPPAPSPEAMKAAATPLPNPEQAKRITALQEEVESLKTQLAAAKSAPAAARPEDAAKIAELEKARETYAARITDLQKQLGEAQQAGVASAKADTAAPAEIRALQTALAERNQEIADLQNQLKARPETAMALAPAPAAAPADKGEVAVLRHELKEKDAQVRAAQQRIASYERDVAQLRRQVGQLQRAGGDTATGNASLARLKRENETLREQMGRQKAQYERRLEADEPTQVAMASAPAAPIASVQTASGGSGLKSLLSRAGISANKTGEIGGASEAYQWKHGPLAGRAQAYNGKGNALDVSQDYANAQRNACTGDFAAVPGPARDGRVSLDLACVDGSGTRTQSTLFAEQGGQVLAFILEAPAEEMDSAMDARDQLSGQL